MITRQLFVLLALVVVLLASCPVKSGIKSLAGIPVNKEQSFAKKTQLHPGNGTPCNVSESVTGPSLLQCDISAAGEQPLFFFNTAVAFLLGYSEQQAGLHNAYCPVPGLRHLPLFLQHRKLII